MFSAAGFQCGRSENGISLFSAQRNWRASQSKAVRRFPEKAYCSDFHTATASWYLMPCFFSICFMKGISVPESCKRCMIRHRLILRQPLEVDSVSTRFFQLAAGIDTEQIPVCHDLEHRSRINLRFSPFRRMDVIQFPVIQFLKLGACQSYRRRLRTAPFLCLSQKNS